jgi:hypothetical protein
LPSSRISPGVRLTAPLSALIKVDLPAPLSPITARISPGYSSKSAMVHGDDAAVALDQIAA